MSKQSEAKESQGYSTTTHACQNCKHYTEKREQQPGVFGGTWDKVSEKRCGIGGFAVEMTAWCKEFEMKGSA